MKIIEMPHSVQVNQEFEVIVRTDGESTEVVAESQQPGGKDSEGAVVARKDRQARITFAAFQKPGRGRIRVKVGAEEIDVPMEVTAAPPPPPPAKSEAADPRTGAATPTGFAALVPPPPVFRPRDKRWAAIAAVSQNVSYERYAEFIENVLCDCRGNRRMCDELERLCAADERLFDNLGRYYGTYTYEDLKQATEIFLLCNAHHSCDPNRNDHEPLLPYPPLEYDKFKAAVVTNANASLLKKAYAFLSSKDVPTPFCKEMGAKLRCTDDMFLEYIWTFYHDIGMLEQTLKAISLRFQNKRTSLLKNQLEDLEISYLRPLTDLLWGYVNDEQHRLSVPRRTVEYAHQYGLAVTGKAVQGVQSIDRRSEFLSAFHTLLLRCHTFFIETSNLTVQADTFPVQNALRDLHKILFDGAHNQFSRATFSSRVEFLIGQWLLGRPEMRLFLRGREMTPYVENWMAPVDAMRRLQGWGEDSVATYRDLAVLGERILLSIRYGEWNEDNISAQDVRNWALSYKEDIQLYCHAYRAVTTVDLTLVDKLDRKQDTSQPVALIEARRKALRAAG